MKCADGKEIIKASIAIVIWKDDEILWSEIIEDVCEGGGSVEAEALAMALLLKRAIQIGIRYFEVCTDCAVIDRVVRGEHIIAEDDKLAELYRLLRNMRGYFEELVCRWVPREGLFTVDTLSNIKSIGGDDIEQDSITIPVPKALSKLLAGDPIFAIKEGNSKLVKLGNFLYSV